MRWYAAVLGKYATFGGRARRREFWMFTLVNAIIGTIVSIVQWAVGLQPDWAERANDAGGIFFGGSFGSGPLTGVYALIMILPALAVGCRRLHDRGRSGWWQLLNLIPIIGIIVLIVWWASDGDPAPNEHGPNPKFVPA
jgi:uncharacterized membrane protein YhaH (DUF805 family)